MNIRQLLERLRKLDISLFLSESNRLRDTASLSSGDKHHHLMIDMEKNQICTQFWQMRKAGLKDPGSVSDWVKNSQMLLRNGYITNDQIVKPEAVMNKFPDWNFTDGKTGCLLLEPSRVEKFQKLARTANTEWEEMKFWYQSLGASSQVAGRIATYQLKRDIYRLKDGSKRTVSYDALSPYIDDREDLGDEISSAQTKIRGVSQSVKFGVYQQKGVSNELLLLKQFYSALKEQYGEKGGDKNFVIVAFWLIRSGADQDLNIPKSEKWYYRAIQAVYDAWKKAEADGYYDALDGRNDQWEEDGYKPIESVDFFSKKYLGVGIRTHQRVRKFLTEYQDEFMK